MKIALINGSPKGKKSSSEILLEELKSSLSSQIVCAAEAACLEVRETERATETSNRGKQEVLEIGLHTTAVPEETVKELSAADAWVFACPLYVDGIPAHLLSCLVQLEKAKAGDHGIFVYGIVNCGFYEGIQTEFALKLLQNWCVKSGLTWGGGIGVGGGGGLAQMPKAVSGKGPMAPIEKALEAMAGQILQQRTQDNNYVSVAFPRFLYKLGAQMGWRQMIKTSGGKAKDLGKR